MIKIFKDEPVPLWRQRLCTILALKKIPVEIKNDIKAALAENDHLRSLIVEKENNKK